MVVVAAFTERGDGSPDGFHWRNAHVIGFVAESMSGRVDEPSGMKSEAVSEECRGVECNECALSPQSYRHKCGHQKAEEKDQWQVVALLEHQNWVGGQVAKVQFRAHLFYLGVLLHQQPAHVREEEAAVDVVRVGVGVSPFVMAAMVPRPFNYVVLESNAVHGDEKYPQR